MTHFWYTTKKLDLCVSCKYKMRMNTKPNIDYTKLFKERKDGQNNTFTKIIIMNIVKKKNKFLDN